MKPKKGVKLNPLKRWRAKSKLTLKELADKAGLDPSTVSLIENGRRRPQLTTLAKLAEVLEVDLDELAELAETEGPLRKKSSAPTAPEPAKDNKTLPFRKPANAAVTKTIVYLVEGGKAHLVQPEKPSRTFCGRVIPQPANIGLFFEENDCAKCRMLATERGYSV